MLYANAAAGLDFGTIGAGLVIWAVLTSSIRLFGDQRDTPAGAEAAARWLGVREYLGRNEVFPTLPPASVAIWDRYLGYGAALGVATAAVHALPMGAEDDHRAWSAYGGRWRAVKVRYPRLGFRWGRKPPLAFLVGLATATAGYLGLRLMLGLRGWTDGYPEADQATRWVRTATTVLAVAALLVVAWEGGRWCARSSTWSPGARSRARWCGGAPKPGERQGRPLHRRRLRAVGGQGLAGPGRGLRALRRWGSQGDRRAPARARFRIEPTRKQGGHRPAPAAVRPEEDPGPGDLAGGWAAWRPFLCEMGTGGGLLADPGVEVDPARVVTGEDAAVALGGAGRGGAAAVPAAAAGGADAGLPVPGGVGSGVGVGVHGRRGPGQAAGPREPPVR